MQSQAVSEWHFNTRTEAFALPPQSTPTRQRAQPRASSTALLDAGDAKFGLFAMLRHQHIPACSIIHSQPQFLPGTDGHPVCIVGLLANSSIACCMMTTSFGSTTIQQKFPDPRNAVRRQFLAIDHGNTVSHVDGQRLLRLGKHDGQRSRMLKQSYVSMGAFFLIETQYLEVWKNNSKYLTADSADYLQSQFRDILSGRTERVPPVPGRPRMPWHDRDYTPAELGLPLDKTDFVLPRTGNCAIRIVAPPK